MLRSKALGSAVGIQYQGVKEQSKINVGQGGGVGIIAGYFRRGGQGIFPVTQNDYRERLGHEPLNPFYIAVSDALKFFPIVWVLRLVGGEVIDNGGGTGSGGVISCEGATDSATLTMSENPDFTIPPTGMTFEVNGVQETFVFGDAGIDMNAFHAKFPNLELGEAYEVRNNSTTEHLRIRFQVYPPEQDGFTAAFDNNPTGGSSNGWATVCLAPKKEIEDDDCSSTTITFEIFQVWNGMNESGYEKSIKLYDATTNELLGIGEAPIEANDGDYSNILPDFIDNLNAGNHPITAIRYINDYEFFAGFKLVSAMHRKFRLEVFIGNEGGLSVVPSPDTKMNDVNIDDSAAYDHGAVIVNFCLAQGISCEGATDNMYFSQLNGDWDVYVDGIFYPSSYNPAATIRENLSSVIHAENDGSASFWNLTNVPHRFRFVPKQSDDGMANYVISPTNINQSFMELEDGSIVFCLAPAQV